MNFVKEAFNKSLQRELAAALSLSCILDLGKADFEIRADELKGKVRHGFISVNEPHLEHFANANVAVEEAFDFVKYNPSLVIELFHGLMIQSWFQFLSGIYREMIYSMRHDRGNFPVGKIKVQIDPSLLSKSCFPDAVRSMISDDFEFRNANEQIQIVAKGLSKEVKDLEPEIAVIRQEILVRNLIQHNKGVVRQQDVEQNGRPFSRIDTSGARNEITSTGNRVERDLFDLRMLASIMYRISEKLLPEKGVGRSAAHSSGNN